MEFTAAEKKILVAKSWSADFVAVLDQLYENRDHVAIAKNTSGFPKKCSGCGRIYSSVEDFISRTDELPNHQQDVCYLVNDKAKILSYRNCPPHCGSTLVIANDERRDTSETGLLRRRLFHDALVIATRTHSILRSQARHDVVLYLMRSIVWEGHTSTEACHLLTDDVASGRFRGFTDSPKVEIDRVPSKKSAS